MSKHSGEGRVFPVNKPDEAIVVKYMYEDWPDASQHAGSRIGSGKIFVATEIVKKLAQRRDLVLRTADGENLRIAVTSNGDLYIIAG
jgi:hypothetical protein